MAMWTDDYCFVSECFLYKRAKPVAWWMYGPDADSQFTESVSGIVSIDHIIIIVTVSKEFLELYNSPLSIQWVQFGVNAWVRINFSKITKLHSQALRAVAICSLWKIYKCLWHQIAREIMLLLVNSQYMKKHHRKSRQTKFWKICKHYL